MSDAQQAFPKSKGDDDEDGAPLLSLLWPRSSRGRASQLARREALPPRKG